MSRNRFLLQYRRRIPAPREGSEGGTPTPTPPTGDILRTLAPEDFGAVGDGTTNDYPAFLQMCLRANFLGGDIILNYAADAEYYFDETFRWNQEYIVDTLIRADASTVQRIIRRPTEDIFDIHYIGLNSLTVNANGATIRCKPCHYTEADIVSDSVRDPLIGPVIPFFVARCGTVTINDLECDGGYLESTCTAIQFDPAAVNTTTGVITKVAHGIAQGESMTLYAEKTTGVLPTGWASTRYHVIRVDADHIKLASSAANAAAGTAIIPSTQGTGTHTLKLSIGQRNAYGLFGQATHFVIDNSSFCNFIGDGFAPKPRYRAGTIFYEGDVEFAVETITITDSHFDRNGRQGISIIGCTESFEMTGGSLNYTGFPGGETLPPFNCPEGVAPAYGMDIEPDRWAHRLVGDVALTNVEVKGNFGGTLVFAGKRGLTNMQVKTFLPAAVDTALNRITIPGHRYPDLQRAPNCGWKVRFTSTGTLPAPLQPDTDYYPFGRDNGANPSYFSVASSAINAAAGTAINITDQGTGTHTCFMHDSPAWQKSFTMTGGLLEHPPRDRALRGASVLALNFGAVEEGEPLLFDGVTIRILDPQAFISPLDGPSDPLFQDCTMETKGGMFKMTLGSATARNEFAYDWRVDGGSITYTGTGAILTNLSTGLVYATYGDFSMNGVTIDLGATPHDGSSIDRIINLTQAKAFTNNTVNTSYSPPGAQRLQVYLVGTETVSGNTYAYSGQTNPYTVTGP